MWCSGLGSTDLSYILTNPSVDHHFIMLAFCSVSILSDQDGINITKLFVFSRHLCKYACVSTTMWFPTSRTECPSNYLNYNHPSSTWGKSMPLYGSWKACSKIGIPFLQFVFIYWAAFIIAIDGLEIHTLTGLWRCWHSLSQAPPYYLIICCDELFVWRSVYCC